jgi:hypothetical protein
MLFCSSRKRHRWLRCNYLEIGTLTPACSEVFPGDVRKRAKWVRSARSGRSLGRDGPGGRRAPPIIRASTLAPALPMLGPIKTQDVTSTQRLAGECDDSSP